MIPTGKYSKEDLIKEEALRLGFSAIGIAKAEPIPDEIREAYTKQVVSGKYGNMEYLRRNEHLRFDPTELLEGCKSIICLAMNYYPPLKQDKEAPQVAYYAYGRDYHKVVKKRSDKLLKFIRENIDKDVIGRSFADSAPILERYWAVKSGIGFRGKSGMIILPRKGTFFVLGELLITTELKPDKPNTFECGKCTKCIDNCPAKAIDEDGFDATKCLSYLTIEQSDELNDTQAGQLGNRLYGCDTCQKVCPHNRFAQATKETEFMPNKLLFDLSFENLKHLDEQQYIKIFAGTSVKRAGYKGLMRTARALLKKRNKKD